jgi:hypothetical protein
MMVSPKYIECVRIYMMVHLYVKKENGLDQNNLYLSLKVHIRNVAESGAAQEVFDDNERKKLCVH